jgi:hypothetical protein
MAGLSALSDIIRILQDCDVSNVADKISEISYLNAIDASVGKFCTYLTTYSGSVLPPFYIGYCKTTNFDRGYHGSVSSVEYRDSWKFELKNSPEKFRTFVLELFDTQEKALDAELSVQKTLSVVKNPLFANRTFSKKKFDSSLLSAGAKQAIKDGLSRTNAGRRMITDGTEQKWLFADEKMPIGFRTGQLEKRTVYHSKKTGKHKFFTVPPDSDWTLGFSGDRKRKMGEKKKDSFRDMVWINDGNRSELVPKYTVLACGWKHGRKKTYNNGPYLKNCRTITDGSVNRRLHKDLPIPAGFRLGVTRKSSINNQT